MRRYEEYKDSNELWYKEIPNNWNTLRLKDITRNLTSGATPSSGNATYYNDGTINWLNTGDLNDGIIINTVKKLNKDVFKDYPRPNALK
jgi:type I restriction enzyme S subunit